MCWPGWNLLLERDDGVRGMVMERRLLLRWVSFALGMVLTEVLRWAIRMV